MKPKPREWWGWEVNANWCAQKFVGFPDENSAKELAHINGIKNVIHVVELPKRGGKKTK